MFKATGLTDADLEKPLVAIANTWTEVGPCNFHLRELAEKVKDGVRKAGGTPLEFNTIVVIRRHLHGHRSDEGIARFPRSYR